MTDEEVGGLESWLKVKRLLAKSQVGLITAEEEYLRAIGWKLVRRDSTHSTWEHPRYEMRYSRNHAIQIAKSEDPNVGYW
jgi:hypothetical protein